MEYRVVIINSTGAVSLVEAGEMGGMDVYGKIEFNQEKLEEALDKLKEAYNG